MARTSVTVDRALDTVARLQNKLAKKEEQAAQALAEREDMVHKVAQAATAVAAAGAAGALDAAVGDLGIGVNLSEVVSAGVGLAGVSGVLGEMGSTYLMAGSLGGLCGNGYRRGFETMAGASFFDLFMGDTSTTSSTTTDTAPAEGAEVSGNRRGASVGAADEEIEIISMQRELDRAKSRVA